MLHKLRAVTRAKLNLSLEVIRKRRDGFHEIETIFQSVDLCDDVHLDLTEDGDVTVACTHPGIPTDASNLCHRAIVAMRPYAGESLGARIRLVKRIPAGSGLGGGSANAAGVMLAVNHAFKLQLSMPRLETIAADLGSDVPFMLHGGTMLGRGRGEILTPLEPLQDAFFLIVRPPISISTAWVYENFKLTLTRHRPRINLRAVNAVFARFPEATMSFRNALEDVVCPAYPAISGVLDELLSTQPCFASMTGSGSALYAVYESQAKAAKLAERFSVRGFFTSVARPAKRAVDIFED